MWCVLQDSREKNTVLYMWKTLCLDRNYKRKNINCVIYVKNCTSLFDNKLMMELTGEFLEAYIVRLLDEDTSIYGECYQLFNDEQELEGHISEHHIYQEQTGYGGCCCCQGGWWDSVLIVWEKGQVLKKVSQTVRSQTPFSNL